MAKSAFSEYVPTEAEQTAAAVETDDTKENSNYLAPALRKKARRCKELSDGSKVLFDELTDASFVKGMSKGPGVILLSKSKLARELNLSRKTIDRRAKQLEQTGFIWTRTEFVGGYELTTWFIREMASAQTELFYFSNPSFGTSKAQERKERRRQPARNKRGVFIKVEKPSEPPSGPSGQSCPDGETPANGHVCPDPTVKVDRSPRSDLTVVNGQDCPQPTVKVDRSPRSKVADIGRLETVKETDSPSSKRLSNRAGVGPVENENDFLRLCLEVFGDREMRRGGPKGDGNGGLWRTLYRSNKAKAKAVLLETRQVKLERPESLKTNWAAYAMDLWKNNRVAA